MRPRDTSVEVLVAAEIIQYSGKTEKNDTMIRKMYVGINLLWIADLFFLVTSITYFQVDKCQNRYHDKDNKGHCCCISKVRHVDKTGIVNIM